MKIKLTIIFIWLMASFLFASYQDSYNFAKKLYSDGLYEEARHEFDNVIKAAPTSLEADEAMYLSGNSLHTEAKYTLAREVFKKHIDAYPNSAYRSLSLAVLGSIYLQTDGPKALQIFKQLFSRYPGTEAAANSLKNYVKAHYVLGQYILCTKLADELISAYPNKPLVSEVLLYKAMASHQLGMAGEVDDILASIENNYAQTDVAGKAFIMRADILAKQNKAEAAQVLLSKTKDKLKRDFDQDLRRRLISYQIDLNELDGAIEQLQYLKSKYSQADYMDKVVYKLAFLKYTQGQDPRQADSELILKNSNLKDSYQIIVANYYLDKVAYQEAQQTLLNVHTLSDSINYEAAYIQAKIALGNGKTQKSLNILNQLIYNKYAPKGEILSLIADVYTDKMHNYRAAINAYLQAQGAMTDIEKQVETRFRLALAYEKNTEIDQAIAVLEKLKNETITDISLKNKIIAKYDFLSQHLLKNYEGAIENMLLAMQKYIDNKDDSALRLEIADIMSNDLKNYAQVDNYLAKYPDKKSSYKRGLLNLKRAEKAKLEYTDDRAYLSIVDSLITLLDREGVTAQELLVRRAIYLDIDFLEITQALCAKFIAGFPQAAAADDFRMLMVNKGNAAPEQIKNYLLELPTNAPSYAAAMGQLALIYYQEKDYLSANKYFDIIADSFENKQLNNTYYHAVSLYNVADTLASQKKLQFIVNQGGEFSEKQAALELLASMYRKQKNYALALKYRELLSGKGKRDDYWQNMADDYLKLGKYKKAKEALANVPDKSKELLRKYADLQVKAGEYTQAIATYKKLYKIDKDIKDLFAQAHIYYLQADYTAAAAVFDQLFALPSRGGLTFSQLASEACVSYYHINNRPRAQATRKKYKNSLKDAPVENAEIDLAAGIYYQSNDINASLKIFKKLIKNDELPSALKERASYQKGLSEIKKPDYEAAEKTFKALLNSRNQELVNQANFKLGSIKYTQDKYQEAMSYYYQVIEDDSVGTLARSAAKNFAVVCKIIKEWEKAISAYELIIERWGSKEIEASTRFDIAFCYYRDRQYSVSGEMFTDLLSELDSRELQAEAQYWIGESAAGEKSWDEAVRAFLKVSYAYSDQGRWASLAELKAGEAYLELRKPASAKSIFERVIKNYGSGSDAGKRATELLKGL